MTTVTHMLASSAELPKLLCHYSVFNQLGVDGYQNHSVHVISWQSEELICHEDYYKAVLSQLFQTIF